MLLLLLLLLLLLVSVRCRARCPGMELCEVPGEQGGPGCCSLQASLHWLWGRCEYCLTV